MNRFFSLVIAAIIGAACIFYPLNGLLLLAALSAYGVLLWFFPLIWLFAVPASLPLLDFYPVTGLLFYNEFDLIFLVTVLVFLLRKPENKDFLAFQ